MDPTIIGGAFAAALVVYGLVERRRLARSAPTRVCVADARTGHFVRVVGRIVDGGALVAPITGRTCVSYDAVVLGPPRNGEIEVAARGVRGTPFVVDDGTGKILVDPRGAYIQVVYDHSVAAGPLVPTKVADPDLVAELTERTDLRYDEGVLTIGETVSVAGLVSAMASAEDEPAYRKLAATTLRLSGGPDRSAVVSERPDDLAAR